MQPPKKEPKRPGESVNIVLVLLMAYANILTPFTRTGEGKKAYASAPFTFFILLAFASNIPELNYLLPPWCVMVLWKRLFPDRRQHTRYPGRSWIAGLVFKREKRARLLEIVLVFLAGLFLTIDYPELGDFIASIAVALWLIFLAQLITNQAERDRMNDARIEMYHQAMISSGRDDW